MLVPAEYPEATDTLLTDASVHKGVAVPTSIQAGVGKDGLVSVLTKQGLSSICINLTPDEAEHFACILLGLAATEPQPAPADPYRPGAAGSGGGRAASAVAASEGA